MPVRTKYFPLGGGLDVSTPAISVPPGRLISCSNFEPDVEGGYKWASGYERFDGSEQPHRQGLWGVQVSVKADTTNLEPLFNQVPGWRVPTRLVRITDADGNEVGHARVCGFTTVEGAAVDEVALDQNYFIGLFKLTGRLEAGMTVDGRFTVGTARAPMPEWLDAPNVDTRQEWLRVVRNNYREAIAPPPGSGPVRGVWPLGDKVYGFRDDQRATQTAMFETTPVERRETRIQRYSYIDHASGAGAAGRMRMYVRGDTDTPTNYGVNTPEGYRRIRRIDFFHTVSGGVSVDPAMVNTRPGDVMRLTRGSDVLEFVVLAINKVGTAWRVELDIQYAAGDLTAVTKTWAVDVETGVFHSAGWRPVPADRLTTHLKFYEGDISEGVPWTEGTEVTATGGFSATVHRVIEWSGGYSTGDAAGVLILRGVTGSVAVDAALVVGGDNVAKAAELPVKFNLPAGERMRFDSYNFKATTGTERAYGCGGGELFEIDENGYFTKAVIPTVEDLTGIGPDDLDIGKILIPAAHGTQLFAAAEGGRLLSSVAGQPLNFSAILSAAEFGLGHEIVGLESVTGGVLVIATEANAKALYGNPGEGFQIRNISEKRGFLLDSIRKVDDVYGLSWAGVGGMTRTDQFGDFRSDTISNAVSPLVRNLEARFACSSLVRRDNLYRLHYTGKRPHYEMGDFRLTGTVGNIDPDTDAGSKLAAVSYDTDDSAVRRLRLPRTDAAKWIESAAGGDYCELTLAASALTLTASSLRFTTTDCPAVVRTDKPNSVFDGATFEIYDDDTDELAGVFRASGRALVNATTPQFSGVYDTKATAAGSLSGNYRIVVRVPPETTDGAGGDLAIGSRAVLHYYEIERFESVADGSRDQALVTLRVRSPVIDDHLEEDAGILDKFTVAVRVEEESTTETLAMYVPERGSTSDMRGTATEERVQFGRTVFPIAIDAAWDGVGNDGERVFLSGADGVVYEDRVGTSFDGQRIVGFLRTPFIHLGMPAQRKRWRQLDLELASLTPVEFKMVMDLDFSAALEPSLSRDNERVSGIGGFWDTDSSWDSFDWDGLSVANASVDLVGYGVNASFLLAVDSDFAEGLVLQGILIHYSPGRIQR